MRNFPRGGLWNANLFRWLIIKMDCFHVCRAVGVLCVAAYLNEGATAIAQIPIENEANIT
jgi:hypothetical protein